MGQSNGVALSQTLQHWCTPIKIGLQQCLSQSWGQSWVMEGAWGGARKARYSQKVTKGPPLPHAESEGCMGLGENCHAAQEQQRQAKAASAAARGSQGQPGAARSNQEQPRAAMSSQEQPGAARGSQGQSWAVRGSHGQSWAARGSLVQPGAARVSQVQPGAARRNTKNGDMARIFTGHISTSF